MFSSEKQFLILQTNDPETITRIEKVLSQTRFRVIRTFDLKAAMLSKFDHDVRELSLLFNQLVILFIYSKASQPVTLTIRINQKMTTIAIVKATEKYSNHHLEQVIMKALIKPENEPLLLGIADQPAKDRA